MSNEGVTLVLGDRRFQVERSWYKLPGSLKLRYVSGVAVATDGKVYVCQRSDPPVVAFDEDGFFVASFGIGVVRDAHGISMDHDGHILVVDRDGHCVVAFDSRGKEVFRLGDRNVPHWQTPFNHPTDIAQASNGDYYVSDGYGNAAVHVFTAEGVHKKTWGRPGRGPGEFVTPHGIVVDSGDRVLVADQDNNRIQVFSLEGEYIEEWDGFTHPMDLFCDDQGDVYVSDETPSLWRLATTGAVRGRCRAALYCGHGVCGGGSGHIYVAESSPIDNLTRLNPLE